MQRFAHHRRPDTVLSQADSCMPDEPVMVKTLHWSDNWKWRVICWCAWSSKIIILLTNTKIVSPQNRLVCSNMQQPYTLHMGDDKLLRTAYGWRQAFTHSIWVTTSFYAQHMGDDRLLHTAYGWRQAVTHSIWVTTSFYHTRNKYQY